MARRKNKKGSRWSPHSMPWMCATARDHAAYMIDVLDSDIGMYPGDVSKVRTEYALMSVVLSSDNLHWVARDLCDVIEQTWPHVPEWTPREVLPADHGVILYASDPGEAVVDDVLGTGTIPVNGVAWVVKQERLMISVLTNRPPYVGDDVLSHTEDPMIQRVLDTPLHHSYTLNINPDKPQGAGFLDPSLLTGDGKIRPAHFTSEDEMRNVLSLLGTTWLLMGQAGMTEQTEVRTPPTSRERKAAQRAGQTAHDVVVRDHRMVRLVASTAPESSGEKKPERSYERRAQGRWWVRGHWRQQAYGPKRSLRKPIFISPHTAGAAGQNSLDARPRVHRYRK